MMVIVCMLCIYLLSPAAPAVGRARAHETPGKKRGRSSIHTETRSLSLLQSVKLCASVSSASALQSERQNDQNRIPENKKEELTHITHNSLF